MEQSHQSQVETNKSIAKLAENVNELVTQERLRTERDAVTAEQISDIKTTQDNYKKSWEWSKGIYEAWQNYTNKYIKPAIITALIISLCAAAGVTIYDYVPSDKPKQAEVEK